MGSIPESPGQNIVKILFNDTQYLIVHQNMS